MREFTALEIIAIISLSYFCLKFLSSVIMGIWNCFLAPNLGFGIKWEPGQNVWAVVTGATDGIGLEYAKQLAQIGYNLVIISRSEHKLKETQNILQQNYNQKVRIICADLSRTDIYQEIAEELKEFDDIHVLVNNAGGAYHIPEYFLEIPSDLSDKFFYLNMLSPTKLMQIILPKMVEKRSGIIINIASSTTDYPLPLGASYAAGKQYLNYLSQALSVEYESKGVYIQTVNPHQVRTKLIKNIHIPLLSVDTHQYVRSALKSVGIEFVTYGHYKHKLISYVLDICRSVVGQRLFLKLAFKLINKVRLQYYERNNNKPPW